MGCWSRTTTSPRFPYGLRDFLSKVVSQCRAEDPARLIEIEVDRLEQLQELLKVDGLHVVLLDNMDCPTMERAVQMRDSAGRKGQVELEASGGVTLETVRLDRLDRR